MTVSSTSSRVIYLGNGSTTVFAFAFKVNQPADLAVVYTDATGIDYKLSPSQYTATGFGLDAGGSVTYPLPGGGPIAFGTRLTIYRDVAVTQPTSLSNQGAMWPQVIEAALDRLTYIAQKVTDAVSRSLVISPTDSASLNVLPNATTRANSVLAFDSAGQPYAGTLTGSLVSVASWLVGSFLNAVSQAKAREAIGAVGVTLEGDQVFDATAGRLKVLTRAAGDNSTDAASTAFVKTNVESAVGGAALRSYLAGLVMSNDATQPNIKIAVAAGVCADDSNAAMMVIGPSGATLDCTINGAGGLDTGSLTSATWYHVFVIGKTDGTTALLASTLVNPTTTMPSGYTLKRRIGSFKTDGTAQIVPFFQNGDRFSWKSAILDVALSTPGNSAVLRAFSVPTNVRVQAWLAIELYQASAVNCAVLVTSPDVNDMTLGHATVPLFTAHTLVAGAGLTFGSAEIYRHTNMSAQLRTKCSGADNNTTLYMSTYGWIDRRGRDD